MELLSEPRIQVYKFKTWFKTLLIVESLRTLLIVKSLGLRLKQKKIGCKPKMGRIITNWSLHNSFPSFLS